MRLARITATASALGLILSAYAYAGDNFSNVRQSGDNNTAAIDQTPGSGNMAGTPALAARQHGNGNVLEFAQSGNGNEIGTGADGFLQQSNRSRAAITQSSSENRVLEVVQTGIASAAGSQWRNTLSIEQKGGAGNTVARAVQTRSGLLPLQPGNEASILQDGAGNTVELLSQTGRDNRADLAFTGNRNLAAAVQQGAGNAADVAVDGHRNDIRVEQQSLLLGNSAQVDVDGSWNRVRIDQSGGNEATTRIDGHANTVSVEQDGANAARIAIDGSYNRIAASQSGAGNSLDLAVNGHGNNALPVFSPGAHASFAGAAGLVPGDVVQNGLLNSIDYKLGDGGLSIGNRFAFAQDGIGNRIEGRTDGIGNQAVVVQQGALNFTSFVQVGNFNVIGVSQQ